MVRMALASALTLAPATGAFAQVSGQGQGQQAQGQVLGQGQSQNPGQGLGQGLGQAQGLGQGQKQEPAAQGARVDVPFTATLGDQEGQVLNGVFAIQRFVHEGAQIIAVGKITATTTNTEGNVQNFVTQARLPILSSTIPGDVCSVLHLALGPLDLDLLGRRVQLDEIALDITAQSVDITAQAVAENPLGNQLCSISGLLNGGGLTNAGARVTALLNQLIEMLG